MIISKFGRSSIATSIVSASMAGGLMLTSGFAQAAPNVDALERFGKYVFFDTISNPTPQKCASCHVPEMGWVDNNPAVSKNGVAVPGANRKFHAVGGRKPPSNAYASFKPPLGSGVALPFPPFSPSGCDIGAGPVCEGGAFWDGRASGNDVPKYPGEMAQAGTHVGPEVFDVTDTNLALALSDAYKRFRGPVADQALGPFGNDVEQNVKPDPNDPIGLDGATSVCKHVKSAKYAPLYEKAWGEAIDCSSPEAAGIAFKRVALSLSAWQASDEVNSFSSPRDECVSGKADDDGKFPCDNLSPEANLGHDIFYGRNDTGKNRDVTTTNPFTGQEQTAPLNAGCTGCHNNKGFGTDGNEPDQLYMDFHYHNLGLPPNDEAANFDPANPDVGLAATLGTDSSIGSFFGPPSMHFGTATLRNVDKRRGNVAKSYMHNGYFKTLKQVVHFYNTASVLVDPDRCPPGTTAAQAMARDCWPAPELTVGNEAQTLGLFGDLGLTDAEEDALVAYLQSLTDKETPKAPKPYK